MNFKAVYFHFCFQVYHMLFQNKTEKKFSTWFLHRSNIGLMPAQSWEQLFTRCSINVWLCEGDISSLKHGIVPYDLQKMSDTFCDFWCIGSTSRFVFLNMSCNACSLPWYNDIWKKHLYKFACLFKGIMFCPISGAIEEMRRNCC